MDLSSDVSCGILPAPDADPFPNTEPPRVLLSYKYRPERPPAFLPGSVVRLDGPDVLGPTTPSDESILIYAKLAGRVRSKMRIGWVDGLAWCPAYRLYTYFIKMVDEDKADEGGEIVVSKEEGINGMRLALRFQAGDIVKVDTRRERYAEIKEKRSVILGNRSIWR
jgi:hypothetical protein